MINSVAPEALPVEDTFPIPEQDEDDDVVEAAVAKPASRRSEKPKPIPIGGPGAPVSARRASTASPDARAALLERLATDVAAGWIATYLQSLTAEGRPIEGGWPGTMPEARMRMDEHARHLLSKHAMGGLTQEELSHFTRLVYDEARKSWLRHRSPAPNRKARA